MRNAIVTFPEHRSDGEERQVLRAAIRQLERADVYVAAVAHMDVDDIPARHAVSQLRADLEALRRHLADLRARLAG